MVKKSQQKPTPEYDSPRETRVLLEQIRSEVKVVSEQHGDIMKKLGEHDTKFERIEQRFDRLEIAVMANGRQTQELKVGQEELKAEVGELRVGQRGLKAGQERIEKKLDNSLANHEQRIRRLEEKAGV